MPHDDSAFSPGQNMISNTSRPLPLVLPEYLQQDLSNRYQYPTTLTVSQYSLKIILNFKQSQCCEYDILIFFYFHLIFSNKTRDLNIIQQLQSHQKVTKLTKKIYHHVILKPFLCLVRLITFNSIIQFHSILYLR